MTKFFRPLLPLNCYFHQGCPNELTKKDDDDYKRYRYFVINRIPKLVFLDAAKVSSAERKEALRIGHLMVVARPAPKVPYILVMKIDIDIHHLPAS